MRKISIVFVAAVLLSLFFTPVHAADVVERDFEFPRDGGGHKGYGIEWWYTSGHLDTADGRSFGFMSAFFKVEKTLVPVHFCMFGLTDESSGKHYAIAKADKSTADMMETILTNLLKDKPDHPFANLLSSYMKENYDSIVIEKPIEIKTSRMAVYFGDSSIEQMGKDKLDFKEYLKWDDVTLDLKLVSEKIPMIVGDRGVVEMGRGGLSYYYSLTRLNVSGTLSLEGEDIPVTGLAWFDHQWGNWDGRKGYHGWDWFSVQLENNMDMNLFSFRDKDGKQINATATILDGEKKLVSRKMEIESHSTWTNPKTGNTYPVNWTVKIPDLDITLEIVPVIPNQEMGLIETIGLLWEGSTEVKAVVRGEPVSGVGYTELTGYAARMMDDIPENYRR